MGEQDVTAVHKIEVECYTNPWTAESFRYEITQSPVSSFFVAEDAGRNILGYIGVWLIEDELHINNLAVKTGSRRQGIAAGLLEHILAYVAGRKVSIATLEVRSSNVAAISLYSRFGFRQAGLRRGYYTSPTDDAIIMTKEL